MAQMITCPRCGEQVKEGSKFCLRCGAPLAMMPAGTSPVPGMPGQPRKRRGLWLVVGLVALLLIGGGVTGILLWQNHQAHTVGTLVKKLTNDAKVYARVDAATELGAKGDPAAIAPLIDALWRDTSLEVQQAAADAAARIGGTEAAAGLAELLTNAELSSIAAGALAQLGSTKEAEAMLAAIDGMDTVELQDMMPSIGPTMSGMLSVPVEDSLASHLTDKSENIRLFSRGILVESESKIAWDALIEALGGPYVAEVQDAMAFSGNPRIDLLIGALGDPASPAPWALADILDHVADSQGSQDATAAVLAFIQALSPNAVATNYPLLIGWGVAGSEPSLIAALEATGDLGMGEAFLNSSNQALDDAATDWGSRHGYVVISTGESVTAGTWGSG